MVWNEGDAHPRGGHDMNGRWLIVGLWVGLATTTTETEGWAQPLTPPAPETYTVQLRYRIRADRDGRILAYRAMTERLKQLGFLPKPREDADLDLFDPTAEFLEGTIPQAGAKRLLEDPRIQTIWLTPSGWTEPAAGLLVPVQITLASGLDAAEQRKLHEQASRQLSLLGFQENFAYDHRGYTRLRGQLSLGELPELLKDLRILPRGWFAPTIPPDNLPSPLRNVLPIRVVEVLPFEAPRSEVDAAAAPLTPPGPGSEALEKFTPDLRLRLQANPMEILPARVELILVNEPNLQTWSEIKTRLRVYVPGSSPEGWLGTVVTLRLAKLADVNLVAALPEVAMIRLPREATRDSRVIDSQNLSQFRELQRQGYRGRGVRVVVIDREFAGFSAELGRGLPATTKLIDLTAEQHPDLTPTAVPMNLDGVSGGVALAKSIHQLAPEATLTLVRIDPTAPHQLLTVARACLGEPYYSEALQSRVAELNNEAESLAGQRLAVAAEYQKAFSDLTDTPEATARREAALQARAKLEASEEGIRTRIRRFTELRLGLEQLAGTQVLLNPLAWNTGMPLDGLSPLSQTLEAALEAPIEPSRKRTTPTLLRPSWVQATATGRGSVWSGPFIDRDGNRALEFQADDITPRRGRWTDELNFLQTDLKEANQTLTAGRKLRFTAQWREPHNSDGYFPQDPVFPLQLLLLRQLDPNGITKPSDEFELVARSTTQPVKLRRTTGASTFEQTLEVTLPTEGVYALRLEGRPSFDYQIPALRQTIEIYPRIVVESTDGQPGAPVFERRARSVGVGVPADALGVLTVGGADSLEGFGPGVTLRTKPDVLGTLAEIGGLTTLLRPAGLRSTDLPSTLGWQPGQAWRLPPAWLNPSPRGRTER